jgi:hypothetical protein
VRALTVAVTVVCLATGRLPGASRSGLPDRSRHAARIGVHSVDSRSGLVAACLASCAWYTRLMSGRPIDFRRRVEGWRAAERREQTLRAREGPMGADAALNAAIELADLFPSATTAVDPTRARDVAQARIAWRKLRTRLACLPVGATNR